MKPTEKFGAAIAHLPIQTPKFPVISNVTGLEVTTPVEIRRTLQDQVTSTVRWVDCMQRLLALSCDMFVELEPGGVLVGLLKRTRRDVDVISQRDVESVRVCVERVRAI